ncbi:MAG: ATP-binding protein [Desulfobacterales bacterium]|nr:ATP-binding protein [Desulfobacterales bacterium]
MDKFSSVKDSETLVEELKLNSGKNSDNLEKNLPETIKPLDIERTIINKRYTELDQPSRNIFEKILKKGRIIKAGQKLDYTNKNIEGYPEFRKDNDGFLYPISAVVEAVIDGDIYIFVFEDNKYGGHEYLTLKIICHPKNLQIAEDFFCTDSQDNRVRISKHYKTTKALKKIFEYIRSNALSYRLTPSKYGDMPSIEIDDEGALIPNDVGVEAMFDEDFLRFVFKNTISSYEVHLDCSYKKLDVYSKLLDNIVYEKQKQKNDKEKVYNLFSPIEVENYNWQDIGGLGEVVQELHELIEYPLKNPKLYKHMKINPPKGILLIGPPGTGKTTIAKILACESKSLFYSISPKDINSMWYGQSERNIGKLFSTARSDVKRGYNVIIYIDEIDGFYTDRKNMPEVCRQAFSQLCAEMDGLSDLSGVVVLAATNRYQDLDPALVRPGRFDRKIFIGKPDAKGREEILKIYLKKKPIASDVDIQELVNQTDEFSGAEIENVCQKAAYLTISRYSKENNIDIINITGEALQKIQIHQQDFLAALEKIKKEKQM